MPPARDASLFGGLERSQKEGSGEKSKKSVHQHGHRKRLRDRFLADPAALPDYELLELLLFMAQPRVDTKPLAKRLIERFGSLAGALTADRRELKAEDGLSDASIAALKAVQEGAARLIKTEAKQAPVITNWQQLLDYCHARMSHEKVEQLRLLFLNSKNMLIADEVQQTGTINETPVYPREVVRRAIELHAAAVIMVHNHPSGDPTPSNADIEITRAVKAALEALDIRLHDHVVIGRKDHVSLRALGMI